MTDFPEVTLENLGGGAASERFTDAMREVVENVQDPNTDAKAKRRVVLTATIAPSEDREGAILSFDVQTKLASPKPQAGLIYMGRKADGTYVAVANDPRQIDAFAEGNEEPDVTPIDRSKEA